MTVGRKLLIGAGAVIIMGMLLVAAFALGVYVGEHGWTRTGLALQGPGGGPGGPPPDNPGRPSPGGPDAPGSGLSLLEGDRRPDLVGRIEDLFEDALMLATPDGPRVVELDEGTQVATPEGNMRSPDDLEHDQLVAIFGRRSDNGLAVVADLIVLLPPRGQSPTGPSERPATRQP